ncbi:MAG: hypothetical protein EA376_11565 [Phycisphaeraceae bacterium]|nr:MAG: hypothetical protein EA376_11565 [Phycisphaeraceae bacterium]
MPPFWAWFWRLVSIFIITVIGGALIGCMWAGAMSYGDTLYLYMGLLFGGYVGFMTSPITLLVLRRKELPTAVAWIYLPSFVAALILGAAMDGLTSIFATIGFYLAACIVVGLAMPNVWPYRPAWRCVKCMYDLRGLPANICPECGAEQPPQSAQDTEPDTFPSTLCLQRYCHNCDYDMNWITSPRCINCGAIRRASYAAAEESSTKPRPPAEVAPDSIT